ncbi:hypothetical protein RFI_00896 [Reticulomyxa filosa]|uniref:Methyltransferase type 11 domain-containing protein n=1 Tax=Reticulomyxa filosa TaxID=46433 RepID=X6PD75_RETFI|nr:hypothetical protein RFI_00896 [Reticulomyxa filosa]|eukprot:ETO36166.1 hypothetical protein RFI_00896 [Reticulomyxa filosa]
MLQKNIYEHAKITEYFKKFTKDTTSITKNPGGPSQQDFDFEGQSELYRMYRPRYPVTLLQHLAFTLESNGFPSEKRDLAVDIACGSGQVTCSLARSWKDAYTSKVTKEQYGLNFKKVIGIDESTKQLEEATQMDNIEYRCENAYNMPFQENSVQLVTIAQGLHWFDHNKLMQQIHRILVKNGICAVLGYSTPVFLRYDKYFHPAFKTYYEETLGSIHPPSDKRCYWNIDRRLLDHQYQQLSFDPPFDKKKMDRGMFYEHVHMNEHQLFGYFLTWSGYRQYMKKHNIAIGDKEKDPLNSLRSAFKKELAARSDTTMLVTIPFFLITFPKFKFYTGIINKNKKQKINKNFSSSKNCNVRSQFVYSVGRQKKFNAYHNKKKVKLLN